MKKSAIAAHVADKTSVSKPQESRRHRFVPEFLLRPWATDGELNAYWWDSCQKRLSCRRRGPKAFCYEDKLLSVERHEEGRDGLERKFFGATDTGGRGRSRPPPC